jgi:hypothetical protein
MIRQTPGGMKDDQWLGYYGAADRVVALATCVKTEEAT